MKKEYVQVGGILIGSVMIAAGLILMTTCFCKAAFVLPGIFLIYAAYKM